MKKMDKTITGDKPFAIILETKHSGLFNVVVEIETEIDKKIPIKRTSESDPIKYEYKKVKDIIEKNIILESVPCVRDYLGNKVDECVYTTNIIAIKGLVDAHCEGAVIHFMSLGE